MLFTKWNWDDAKEVWQDEAREDGIEEGKKEGKNERTIEIAKNALSKGSSIEFIHKITGLDVETINSIAP
jgi:predicted transposase/invertase (TIGR01784 family)